MPKGNDNLKVTIGETTEVTEQVRQLNETTRWLWFPQINRFSTGELLVGFWMVPDETYMEGCFSGYCLSEDGGRTWSRRYTKGLGGWCKYAFDDGSLMEISMLTVADPPGQNKELSAILTWFTEGGRVMHQEGTRIRFPRPIHLSIETPTVQVGGLCFCRSILEMPEGYLLASMYGMGFEGDEQRGVILVKSEDRGKSWEYFSTICDGATVQSVVGSVYRVEECSEPCVVELANGDLLAIFRTQSYQDMYQCWSHDGGKTWTKPVSAGVGSVLPKLLLLSNGVLACSYGRPGVHIMFSLDGTGRRWSHHTEIPLEGRYSKCYTDMIEVRPGEVLLTYDTGDKNLQKEQDIRITRISVERL